MELCSAFLKQIELYCGLYCDFLPGCVSCIWAPYFHAFQSHDDRGFVWHASQNVGLSLRTTPQNLHRNHHFANRAPSSSTKSRNSWGVRLIHQASTLPQTCAASSYCCCSKWYPNRIWQRIRWSSYLYLQAKPSCQRARNQRRASIDFVCHQYWNSSVLEWPPCGHRVSCSSSQTLQTSHLLVKWVFYLKLLCFGVSGPIYPDRSECRSCPGFRSQEEISIDGAHHSKNLPTSSNVCAASVLLLCANMRPPFCTALDLVLQHVRRHCNKSNVHPQVSFQSIVAVNTKNYNVCSHLVCMCRNLDHTVWHCLATVSLLAIHQGDHLLGLLSSNYVGVRCYHRHRMSHTGLKRCWQGKRTKAHAAKEGFGMVTQRIPVRMETN